LGLTTGTRPPNLNNLAKLYRAKGHPSLQQFDRIFKAWAASGYLYGLLEIVRSNRKGRQIAFFNHNLVGSGVGTDQGITIFAPPADAESSPKTLSIFFFTNQNKISMKSPTPRTAQESEGQGTIITQESAKNETKSITDLLAERSNS
jgi:hypothetical protein